MADNPPVALDVVTEKEWKPPFCAQDTTLDCPKCGAKASVRVREKDTHFDGDCEEAYCCECRSPLEVQVSVVIDFSDPEVPYAGEVEP